jgi:hypothetical protein
MNYLPQAPENSTRVITNFSKIRGDIRKPRCTTGTGDKFATGTGTASVVIKGGKFATGARDQ